MVKQNSRMKFSKSSLKCTKTISKVEQYFNTDTFWPIHTRVGDKGGRGSIMTPPPPARIRLLSISARLGSKSDLFQRFSTFQNLDLHSWTAFVLVSYLLNLMFFFLNWIWQNYKKNLILIPFSFALYLSFIEREKMRNDNNIAVQKVDDCEEA